ncbi:MAG: hypothetical protein INQ03_12365 [Candidatus Heimdallarchaeota archaeon]|nr:hypothetical protein [Candidatus Heimdallarchaeota archaeon]
MRIVMVPSGYGLGHLTRSIALINALIEVDPTISISLVVNYSHLELLKQQKIPEQVILEQQPILPILVMEDEYTIDVEASIGSYQFSLNYDTQVRDDMTWGRILQGSDLVINDIESTHNILAKKMDIPILNISNFTWADILEGMGAELQAEEYTKQIALATEHIKLPFATPCRGFDNAKELGLISREINHSFVKNIRDHYPDKKIIYLQNLTTRLIENFEDLIVGVQERNLVPIFPQHLVTKLQNPSKLITFSKKSEDTHNLIATSDLAFAKVGYSTVAECFAGGTYLLHWIRSHYSEDEHISNDIEEKGFGKRIDIEIGVQSFLQLIDETLLFLEDHEIQAVPIKTKSIAEYILDTFRPNIA